MQYSLIMASQSCLRVATTRRLLGLVLLPSMPESSRTHFCNMLLMHCIYADARAATSCKATVASPRLAVPTGAPHTPPAPLSASQAPPASSAATLILKLEAAGNATSCTAELHCCMRFLFPAVGVTAPPFTMHRTCLLSAVTPFKP